VEEAENGEKKARATSERVEKQQGSELEQRAALSGSRSIEREEVKEEVKAVAHPPLPESKSHASSDSLQNSTDSLADSAINPVISSAAVIANPLFTSPPPVAKKPAQSVHSHSLTRETINVGTTHKQHSQPTSKAIHNNNSNTENHATPHDDNNISSNNTVTQRHKQQPVASTQAVANPSAPHPSRESVLDHVDPRLLQALAGLSAQQCQSLIDFLPLLAGLERVVNPLYTGKKGMEALLFFFFFFFFFFSHPLDDTIAMHDSRDALAMKAIANPSFGALAGEQAVRSEKSGRDVQPLAANNNNISNSTAASSTADNGASEANAVPVPPMGFFAWLWSKVPQIRKVRRVRLFVIYLLVLFFLYVVCFCFPVYVAVSIPANEPWWRQHFLLERGAPNERRKRQGGRIPQEENRLSAPTHRQATACAEASE
jgi:hypothetical protein